MTFSKLISGTIPHHGKYNNRPHGQKVSRVIQHHWASTANGSGDATLSDPDRQASATYLIHSDGVILGQVPEEYRPWTSGSAEADNSSITIECQNSTGSPSWQVSAAAFDSIVRLVADIATRYGWGSLDSSRYRGHKEFASTACPGPYLWDNRGAIIAAVNDVLGGNPLPPGPNPGDGKLAVDGQWGPSTAWQMQDAAGTTTDGVISHQWQSWHNENIYAAQFDTSGEGSDLGRWIQERLVALGKYQDSIDGLIGPATITAMQRYYGTTADGVISPVSDMVKAAQRELNDAHTFLGN